MLQADKYSINKIRSLYPGAIFVEPYTVEFQAKDYKEILQALVLPVRQEAPAPEILVYRVRLIWLRGIGI